MRDESLMKMLESITKSITACVSVISVCLTTIKVTKLIKNGEPIVVEARESKAYDEEVNCE